MQNSLARGVSSTDPVVWFNKDRVNLPQMKEVLFDPLYDSMTYPAAGAASLTFFQEQIGKGTPAKTESDTNLDMDGQVGKGKAFKITGISVAFYPGANSNVPVANPNTELNMDVYTFAQNGSLTLKIGDKEFLKQGPLGKFPPVECLAVNASMYGDGASDSSVKYATTYGREFAIVPKLLESNQSFRVELRDLPALPSNIDGRLVVRLNGFLGRNSQ